jgi:putative sterol carrier protein
VILSVAGFAEDWIFDGLSHYVHFLFGRSGRLMAEIYRPGAMLMTQGAAEFLPDILAATQQAGHELVTTRGVSPETLARIRRPLADAAQVACMANLFWQTCIDAKITPKTLEKQRITPRPRGIQDYLTTMEMGFNPAGAAGVQATLQFEFSGDVAGPCYLQVAGGQLHGHAGAAEQADLIIRAPFETWIDVVTGQTPGMQAFMSGQCRAEGDFSLLMQFEKWFQRRTR